MRPPRDLQNGEPAYCTATIAQGYRNRLFSGTFKAASATSRGLMQEHLSLTSEPDLERFVAAQAGSYQTALAELRRGAKRSHWMWFIFPQIAGLGTSAIAQHYAIRCLDEARGYLEHAVLGPRLKACVEALQDLPPTSADAVFGTMDAMKLRSSLTLFSAAGGGTIFQAALQRWFAGRPDNETLQRLDTTAANGSCAV